ncbi:hypothetical protein FHW67_002280 [Herbaspirillum sp. Sphag1AN]|nr:hypothetical protein [Herbaspirillum sp. Sphag1AN]MBB3246189.1 hypothetical protein [Herbaspirillum sp. Sphag64]
MIIKKCALLARTLGAKGRSAVSYMLVADILSLLPKALVPALLPNGKRLPGSTRNTPTTLRASLEISFSCDALYSPMNLLS